MFRFFPFKVHYQTLYSDFINGDLRLGVVTATGGTLIAHGTTTVHATRVIGTRIPNVGYAQVSEGNSLRVLQR